MKVRQDIVQKFSTFLKLGNRERYRQFFWQTDPELERNIKNLEQSDPNAKAEFWARRFLQEMQKTYPAKPHSDSTKVPNQILPNSLPGRHLSAYLQDVCFWAAQKLCQRLQFIKHKYPLEECFQIACSVGYQPEKVFRNFKFDHPSANTEVFAKAVIFRIINNQVYESDLEAKRGKYSNYGLLKDLTKKELTEALAAQRNQQLNIELHCLAWKCFDEIYQPNHWRGSRSMDAPDRIHLNQIADRYNQLLAHPGSPVDATKIQEMLDTCIKAARNYRTQQFLPLEDYTNTPAPASTAWDTLVREEEWDEIQVLVSSAFQKLPVQGQMLFKLWLGLNLTQTNIANVLKNKYTSLETQYQVSRLLKSHTKNLLKDFAKEWNQINRDTLLAEKQLEQLKNYLHDCLRKQTQEIWYGCLAKILVRRSDFEKTILKLHYAEKLSLSQIAKTLAIPTSEIAPQIASIYREFRQAFINEIASYLDLLPESLMPVEETLGGFIEEWLQNTAQF
ncbi:sigma-70 family RNA polymerase sigma factor [Planktothrix sp. FACHB-1355]|uniref:Sigma-70 family RNA polymerase sigma factor n=1 Tax=Aerosakkonema funiforme FACHB-1375 TaxID=2949571 RepID=A0A926VB77_9CYAN|nr:MULTISPECIES: sigma-70 family RNA polymerase sigma factor [Oscillatoriales]MBD2180581.1 sigma-70 family RNA polymerase sigma factor [Aerosakkonema funiforme FACHB-1375]MBD3559779.1 sigma-70 family RNA polymerase sigma factor [Planktothrix sp. FACHB-1355]